MDKTISSLNIHRVIKKLRWNQAETEIADVTMLWNGNELNVTKIFDDVYSVTCIKTFRNGGYEVRQTYLVDLKHGVSPVEKFENDYEKDWGKHVIFQDAPYRPFNRNKVKWFIFEVARFLKHGMVAEGSDVLREMLEKVKAIQNNVALDSMGKF